MTEGRGEIVALPHLYKSLEAHCGIRLLNPIHAPVHPTSPLPLLCNQIIFRVRQAKARGADSVVVILDTEAVEVDPTERASEIAEKLKTAGEKNVLVAMKHVKFENWLISDPDAFEKQRSLFPDYKKVRYPDGRADFIDAESLIKQALGSRRSYSKTQHPPKITSKSQLASMVKNSQSFRDFVFLLSRSAQLK
ncbi:DUF4276 family protein [Amycolatopsis lurida]